MVFLPIIQFVQPLVLNSSVMTGNGTQAGDVYRSTVHSGTVNDIQEVSS